MRRERANEIPKNNVVNEQQQTTTALKMKSESEKTNI